MDDCFFRSGSTTIAKMHQGRLWRMALFSVDKLVVPATAPRLARANGRYRLRIVDERQGQTGVLEYYRLDISSRYD